MVSKAVMAFASANSSVSSSLSLLLDELQEEDGSFPTADMQGPTPVSIDSQTSLEDEGEDQHHMPPPTRLDSPSGYKILRSTHSMPLSAFNSKRYKISPSWEMTGGGSLPVPMSHGSSGREHSQPLLLDLRGSPLTASSFQALEREYDQDTWRMYNRISASRRLAKSAGQQPIQDENAANTGLKFEVVSHQQGILDEKGDGISIVQDGKDEPEGIFDLDL
jgi:hypothetical protein